MVIGKQTTDVWVFNKTIQIDDTGSLIPREAQGYILLDDTSLPVLSGITTIDDGEALQKLILAEKSLLANNFPQGLMTIACVAIGANYDLVVKKFGGCALPVLFGAPQSAKTTALKAALSVVGNTDIVQAFSSLAASTSSSTGKGKAAISPRDVQGTDKGETCSPIDVQGIDKGETNSPIDVQDTDKSETSCTPIDVQGAEKGETYPPIDVQGIEKGETYAPIDVQGSDKRETYPPSYVQATKTDRSLKTKSRKGKGKAQDKLKDALTPSDELPAKRIRKNKTTN